MAQPAPDNQILQPESENAKDEPWRGKCSYGCYHAKGKRKKCKCRCSGKLHGKATEEHNERLWLAELEEPCGE